MSREKVEARLRELGIVYQISEHAAVFTIEELDLLSFDGQGEVCKNLFLRDAKGTRHFLVVLQKDKRADLKRLRGILGTTALSFASEERLARYLALTKGAVTPLAVVNDPERAVEVLIDEDLAGCPCLGVHPGVNTATAWLSRGDLVRYIEADGRPVRFIKI